MKTIRKRLQINPLTNEWRTVKLTLSVRFFLEISTIISPVDLVIRSFNEKLRQNFSFTNCS